MRHEISVILHNIRSAHNVGSIFRTADGAGVSKIYLVGYTPTPTDRFGREQPEIAKTALGAHEILEWEYFEDIDELISDLKEKGIMVVSIEQTDAAIDYKTYSIKNDMAVTFGNEVDGVPQDVLAKSDAVLEIPMHGEKESLNVAVSAGIVLYRLCDG